MAAALVPSIRAHLAERPDATGVAVHWLDLIDLIDDFMPLGETHDVFAVATVPRGCWRLLTERD